MHRWLLIPMLVGFLGMLTPFSAADEPAPKHDSKAEAVGHHDSGHGAKAAPGGGHGADAHGGEKESPLSIKADLGIWTLVIFFLLLFILSRLAWKPMLEGLQKREETIRDAMEQAAKARREAEQLQSYLNEQRAKMGEEVRAHMEEARRDAQRVREDLVAQAKAEIQTERERLHRELDLAKDQALQQIWNQAADLATVISAKTLRRHINTDDHRRLVDDALTDLRQAGAARAKEVTKIL